MRSKITSHLSNSSRSTHPKKKTGRKSKHSTAIKNSSNRKENETSHISSYNHSCYKTTMATDLKKEHEEEAFVQMLQEEEAKVSLEQQGKEHLAIFHRKMEKKLEYIQQCKAKEIEEAVEIARQSLQNYQENQIEAIERQTKQRLREMIASLKAVNNEKIQERKLILEKDFDEAIQKEQRRLRQEGEEELETHIELATRTWEEDKKKRLAECRRQLEEIRLIAISERRKEFALTLHNEIESIKRKNEASLTEELDTLKHTQECERQTRLTAFREQLQIEREERLNKLTAQHETELKRKMNTIESDMSQQLTEEIDRMTVAFDCRFQICVNERLEACRQANHAAIQELKKQQQQQLETKLKEQQALFEREVAIRNRELIIEHTAEIHRQLLSIQVRFDCDQDRNLMERFNTEQDLMEKLQILAKRYFELRKDNDSRRKCRTCQKLLAYNVEILSQQQNCTINTYLERDN